MTQSFLDLCDGPACTRCGCRDSEILKEPIETVKYKDGVQYPYTMPGRARCGYCRTEFSFFPKDEKSVRVAPNCPECGSTECYVASTLPSYRKYKCKSCGAAFKKGK